MLKKSQRLLNQQFNEVIKNGKIVTSPLFIVRYLENQESRRISAVAPTKIFKKASARNRVRRIIYQALENIFPSINSGIHAIILAKADFKDISLSEISEDIKKVLNKAGVIGQSDK